MHRGLLFLLSPSTICHSERLACNNGCDADQPKLGTLVSTTDPLEHTLRVEQNWRAVQCLQPGLKLHCR